MQRKVTLGHIKLISCFWSYKLLTRQPDFFIITVKVFFPLTWHCNKLKPINMIAAVWLGHNDWKKGGGGGGGGKGAHWDLNQQAWHCKSRA